MKKRLDVINSSVEENKLKLMIEDSLTPSDAKQLHATGSMLVDSDHLALIYILENDTDFVYLAIGNDHWEKLSSAIDEELIIELHIQTTNDELHKIELENITAEFAYLKDNIADNANYGEEMVNKFSEVFLPQK
ncbi:hypothetical protein CIB95_01525 [Lottiidibacillus patelloidae]|uniref:Uncharacterized protein n=2 Tax=Lottiidibacillus patelloidae TaxID=2670334 RepID=A0A263BXH2_9BACI|nr:hypothetical protein CIB95_01525 [Lottiidibacillus patelloidae]